MVSYDDYKSHLAKALAGKSLSAQQEFGRNVLRRMLLYAEQADKSTLWEEEATLIESVIETLRAGSFDLDQIERTLDRLNEITQEDEYHAIEMNGDLISFLCGLDSLVALERRQDRQAAARISGNLMDMLDQRHTEDTPLSEWLTTIEIREEFEQQLEVLRQLT